MRNILETLQALQNTPVPNLLVIAGFILLFLAFVGKFGAFVELPKGRQKWAGIIGALLLVFGIGLFIAPSDTIPPDTASVTPDTPTAAPVLPTNTPAGKPTDTPDTTIPFIPGSGDDFNDSSLDPRWSWNREDPSHWSLTTRPGYLHITTQWGDIYETTNNAQNLLLQQAPEGDFIITTRLTIDPDTHAQQAGLLIYQDDDNYIRVTRGHMFTSDRVEFVVERSDSPIIDYDEVENTTIYLAISKYRERYTGSYSLDGNTWFVVGKSDNVDLAYPKIGIGAWNAVSAAPEIPVYFDFFHVKLNSN